MWTPRRVCDVDEPGRGRRQPLRRADLPAKRRKVQSVPPVACVPKARALSSETTPTTTTTPRRRGTSFPGERLFFDQVTSPDHKEGTASRVVGKRESQGKESLESSRRGCAVAEAGEGLSAIAVARDLRHDLHRNSRLHPVARTLVAPWGDRAGHAPAPAPRAVCRCGKSNKTDASTPPLARDAAARSVGALVLESVRTNVWNQIWGAVVVVST